MTFNLRTKALKDGENLLIKKDKDKENKRKKIQEIVIKIMRNRTGYELASNENF